jgi:hypothetical protein
MSAFLKPSLALVVALVLAGCSMRIRDASLSFPLGDNHEPAVAFSQPDPNWAKPEPKAYLAKLANKVDDEWYMRVAMSRNALPASGTVVLVTATLTSDGRIQDVTTSGNDLPLAKSLCLEALQANQPYGKWSDAMMPSSAGSSSWSSGFTTLGSWVISTMRGSIPIPGASDCSPRGTGWANSASPVRIAIGLQANSSFSWPSRTPAADNRPALSLSSD